MAKAQLHPIFKTLRGQLGDLVFRLYGDKVVVSLKPDIKDREWSEAQLAQQERFRQAALYGKTVMADPETKAVYERAARAQGKPVFSLTVADFFHAPSVDEVDLSGYTGAIGDEIAVTASDDFEVVGVGVSVSLTGVEGDAIEGGEAVETPPGSGKWVYTATAIVLPGTTVRVAVTARDRPGNVGEAEAEKAV